MPGFNRCSWCQGKGCMCCDAERAKWEKAEAKRIAEWAAKDPREKLASLERSRPIVAAMGGKEAEAALDAEIATAKAECDAEYARQFPDGPKPIFTAKRGNPDDMKLLESAFGVDVLTRAFGDGGRGMEEFEELATNARATQAMRDYASGSAEGRD